MKSLLKVTRKAELGLLLVSELALHAGELVSLEVVSKKTRVSRKFLEQVAGELLRAGIVEGIRGATGGYRLVRDPKVLTVAEVLNAVEGPMEMMPVRLTRITHAEIGIITKIQDRSWRLMNTTVSDLA
jgi:Rrf2 family protein